MGRSALPLSARLLPPAQQLGAENGSWPRQPFRSGAAPDLAAPFRPPGRAAAQAREVPARRLGHRRRQTIPLAILNDRIDEPWLQEVEEKTTAFLAHIHVAEKPGRYL